MAKPDGSARPQKAAQPANGAQPAKATQQAGAAQPNGTATTAKAAQAGGPARTATTSQQGGTAQQGNAARPQKAAQPNKTPQAAKVPQVNPTPSADQKPTSQPEPANAPETAPVEETPETPDLRERFVSEAKRFLSNPIAYFQQSKRAIVVAVLLLVYIVGSLFFSYHFLPGTEINGAPASMASVRTLAQHAEEAATDYKVNISGDEVNATINGTGIAFAFDADAYRHEATSKLPGWAWPVKLFTPRNYILESAMTYDKDLLQDLVDSAVSEVNENKTAPKDATVSYDAKSRTFSAVEEEPGTNVDLDRTTEKVKAAIQTLQREVQLDENDLEQPAVTTKDSRFDQALARANQLNNLAIPLAVEGEKVETIEPEQICKWITINKDYQPSGDLEEITYWAQSDLSDEVDTVGTQRTYLRPDGQKEQVAGGSYGWIIDGKSLAVLIQERIEQNSNEIIEIPMSATAINYNRGGQDWGNRYIDVDLTAQYVRFYDNNANLIWESECVSGDISQSQATITGVYTIQDKESPATLVGLDYDFDGEPDYENEVEYWMPFYGGYGLHDALWRSYFGEDIYQYDGSHGCVNLPYYKAQSLYEMVRVGDVVVVHY